jgi:RND family efflux transporter MFP subunit
MRRGFGIAVLFVAGCSDVAPPPAEAPLTIRVATVGASDAPQEVSGVGTAAWRVESPLGFTSPGQIAAILVNEGDRVRRGQLLATLKTTPMEADLSAAQAEARRTRLDTARVEALYKQGWVTKARLESAQAGADASAASVRARRFNLDTARIVAPSDGVVLARVAEPTQVLAAGAPVLVVGESNRGRVIRVPVNDRDAARIERGAPATVTFDALGVPLQGAVIEAGARASQTTGTFEVEISLPGDARIRSGMMGRVSIAASGGGARRMILPAAAVLSPRAGEGVVFAIDARNRARRKTVSIGELGNGGIEILSGLAPGDRVALSGFDRLRDGVTVAPRIALR